MVIVLAPLGRVHMDALRLTGIPQFRLGLATRYQLQSLLFLSGCALSSAIIQEHFSAGTSIRG